MQLNKLQFALLFSEEFLDVFSGLVVHDIDLGLEAFGGEYIELFLVCLEDAFILQSRYWGDQDGI
jgi:hypothetical protein